MPVIKVFGYLTDILGWAEKSHEIDGDITVSQLLERVFEEKGIQVKDVVAWLEEGRLRVLVNGSVASLTDTVKGEDEVAIIPPSAGG